MTANKIEVLISRQEIDEKIDNLAEQINKDFEGKPVTALCILTGAVVFMTDLIRKLDLDLEIDFMEVSSYASSTQSSGVVRINRDIKNSIKDKNVLLVEDIIDSGRTLSHIKKHLLSQNPKNLRICTLLDKPQRRVVNDVTPDYIGFTISDKFVIGYGLDYDNKYRNLPYVGVLEQ